MRTIIPYFCKSTSDSTRGGALFIGAFDRYWVQDQTIFDRLYATYSLQDEYIFEFLRISPRWVG